MVLETSVERQWPDRDAVEALQIVLGGHQRENWSTMKSWAAMKPSMASGARPREATEFDPVIEVAIGLGPVPPECVQPTGTPAFRRRQRRMIRPPRGVPWF